MTTQQSNTYNETNLALDISCAVGKVEKWEHLISKAFSTSTSLNDDQVSVPRYEEPTWPLRMERLKKTLRTAQKKGTTSKWEPYPRHVKRHANAEVKPTQLDGKASLTMQKQETSNGLSPTIHTLTSNSNLGSNPCTHPISFHSMETYFTNGGWVLVDRENPDSFGSSTQTTSPKASTSGGMDTSTSPLSPLKNGVQTMDLPPKL
nr:MAG: hypothetical protein [Chemarfal virus 55]